MCRTVTDIFKQKVSELTFMNDNFQIHSKEKKTYPHAIDQNCVTYICIPGEPSSMVTFHSQPSHPASSFQSSKKKRGKQEKPCQNNLLKSFRGCIDTRMIRLVGTEEAAEKCPRQKPFEIPAIKEFVF